MNTVEARSILEFSKGDIITQVKRSEGGDGSYLGVPIMFSGIVNNLIYGTIVKNKSCWKVGDVVELYYEQWAYCWNEYVNPETELGIKLESEEQK